MKKLIYLLFIITFISCNKSEDSPVSEFAGNYKIVSIISEKAVDMNNDGIVSNDVYLEIISFLIPPFLVSVQSKQKRRKQTNML